MSKKCVVNRNEDGIITSVEVKNISYSNENSITDSSVNNINNDKYNYAVNSNNGNDLDIAPNGKPSLLYKSYIDLGYSEIEAKNLVSEVYTDEFKKWFGDWQNDPENSSKVVDENGQPKIVWSGNTSSILGKNINNSVFQGYRIYGNEYNNFEKDGDNQENYRFSNTALFVEDKKLATTYATGINAFRTPANIINKYAPKDSFLEPIFLNVRNYEKVDEVSNKIIPRIDSSIQEGIDGFYGGNRGEYREYKTWAILDADQARSAKHISFQTDENVLVGAVINTLKNKGLVSDVKLLSNDEMTSKLIELGVPENIITNKDQEALNTELSERGLKSIVGGFYKKDTRQIFLNKDSNNLLNTTIHEFSHPMIEWLIENRKDLFNSGIDLLKNNKNEIANYIKRVDTLYPNIKKDSDAYWEEVMAEIIANNGVDLINKEKKSIIKEWLDRILETFKSMVGITGYTAEEVSNMTVKEFANAVNAEMFNEVSLDTLLRVGRNIGYEFDTELTARERFNISKLKRISAGSDRIVYELDDNKVIKIAKTARGLMQNIYEGSYDLVEEELLPDIYERGLNYVIVEKVSPIKAKDLVPTYDVEGDQIGTEKAEKMFADFSKFSQIDFDNSSQKLIDTLYKYGMFYILNREVLFGDFSRKANWGIKNGKPIHLDGGTFAGTRLLSEYRGKSNLEDEDFKEVYNRSKSFKKIIGDRDRNTMFSLIDNNDLDYSGNIKPEVLAEIQSEREAIRAEAQANGTFMKAPNGNATNLNEAQWIDVRTKRFKDWFGDWQNDPENSSKVVDENGEPMVVYHGTTYSKFYSFKESNIGIFFTDSKEKATGYANGDNSKVVGVFLDIKNPLVNNYSSYWEKIFLEPYKQIDIRFDVLDVLYDDDKIHVVKNNGELNFWSLKELMEDIEKNKNDYPSDIIESINFEFESAKKYGEDKYAKINNYFNEKGEYVYPEKIDYVVATTLRDSNKDGLIFKNISDNTYHTNVTADVFALQNPSQIKSATENIGTYSANTNDIRYSLENIENINVVENDYIESELFKDISSIPFITKEQSLGVYKSIYTNDLNYWEDSDVKC